MPWTILLYFVAVVTVTGGLLLFSHVLSPRGTGSAREQPYESGIVPTDSAHQRVSVRFYVVAVLFLLFDVEAAFLLVWALVVRQVGWLGFAAMSWFATLLLLALAYLWRNGALDWGLGSASQKRRTPRIEDGHEVVAHADSRRSAETRQHVTANTGTR